MPKFISFCAQCGTVLPLWKIRCLYCRRSALNWLHVIVLAVLAVPAVFLVLRIF